MANGFFFVGWRRYSSAKHLPKGQGLRELKRLRQMRVRVVCDYDVVMKVLVKCHRQSHLNLRTISLLTRALDTYSAQVVLWGPYRSFEVATAYGLVPAQGERFEVYCRVVN